MTEYRIAAIPTVYRGRQYRSRLEARWAAFFDLLGWQHEYEPFDLGKWSPDFLLHCPNGDVLVEVKPITEFDEATANKMVGAVWDRALQDDLLGLLLVGIGPAKSMGMTRLGWLGALNSDEPKATWTVAPLVWWAHVERPVMEPDFLSLDMPGCDPSVCHGWQGHMTEAFGRDYPTHLADYDDHNLSLWARATNAVQWRGRGGA